MAQKHETHDVETQGRLLAKIVRELLKRDTCESLPDLTEALKCRCARLRIRWTNDGINDAYRLISSNTALPGDRPRVPVLVERPPEPETFSRVDAALVLATLQARLGTIALKRIPTVRTVTPFARDRVKAAQMLAGEIVASIARCEALEAHPAPAAVGLSDDPPSSPTRATSSSSSSSSSVEVSL
jgi:hypothetical protein